MFVEVPGFFSTLRVDEIVTLSVSGNSLLVRVKGVSNELSWEYRSDRAAKRAYNRLLKSL